MRAQLVVTRVAADVRYSPRDVGASTLRRGAAERLLADGRWREPERIGIEFQQARRLRSGIAELEAQLDRWPIGERAASGASNYRPPHAARWNRERRCRSRNGR